MMKFVSRAGSKLEHALAQFHIDVTGLICADLGCSTGGFTHCLLSHGAAKVYAVDTGYGVLDWKLRQDSRVVVLERTNALHVTLPQPVDLVTVDVGWTRQSLILPAAVKLLSPGGQIISLLKPHYEAPPHLLVSGFLPPSETQQVFDKVLADLRQLGLPVSDFTLSPLKGEKGGNSEYLLLVRPPVSL